MTIKQDFVTNSSSTCYIVNLPENFKIESEDLELNQKIELYINQLKTTGDVEFGSYADYGFKLSIDKNTKYKTNFEIDYFTGLIYEKIMGSKFLIYKVEGCGSDSPDRIINLNSQKLKENKGD